MNIIEKIKLIDNLSKVFSIKAGTVIKKESKSYQVPLWCSFIFSTYYHTTACFFAFVLLYMTQAHYFDNIVMQFFESLIIYLLAEYLVVIFLPLDEVSALEDFKEALKSR